MRDLRERGLSPERIAAAINRRRCLIDTELRG